MPSSPLYKPSRLTLAQELALRTEIDDLKAEIEALRRRQATLEKRGAPAKRLIASLTRANKRLLREHQKQLPFVTLEHGGRPVRLARYDGRRLVLAQDILDRMPAGAWAGCRGAEGPRASTFAKLDQLAIPRECAVLVTGHDLAVQYGVTPGAVPDALGLPTKHQRLTFLDEAATGKIRPLLPDFAEWLHTEGFPRLSSRLASRRAA